MDTGLSDPNPACDHDWQHMDHAKAGAVCSRCGASSPLRLEVTREIQRTGGWANNGWSEIIRVKPRYHELDPTEKAKLLRLVIEWAQFELSRTPEDA